MSNKRENRDFRDFSQEWLEYLKPQVKESTYNKYHNLLETYIYPRIGERSPEVITCAEMEAFCRALLVEGGAKKSGLSPKTVTDSLTVVRRVFKFAATHSEVKPCDISSVRVKQGGGEMRVLSRVEQDKLCRYLCADRNGFHAGILVCLFTGLRVGEICALRWEDISFEEQTLHVHRTMQRIQDPSGAGPKTRVLVTSPKSRCSIRTIPLPEELLGIIRTYQRVSSGWFLTNSAEKYVEPRLMQKHFKEVVAGCGIAPVNFHALRHTFATRCVELGVDAKSLSEILGHASVTITMNRYVHPSMELKRENMNRLSVLFVE